MTRNQSQTRPIFYNTNSRTVCYNHWILSLHDCSLKLALFFLAYGTKFYILAVSMNICLWSNALLSTGRHKISGRSLWQLLLSWCTHMQGAAISGPPVLRFFTRFDLYFTGSSEQSTTLQLLDLLGTAGVHCHCLGTAQVVAISALRMRYLCRILWGNYNLAKLNYYLE